MTEQSLRLTGAAAYRRGTGVYLLRALDGQLVQSRVGGRDEPSPMGLRATDVVLSPSKKVLGTLHQAVLTVASLRNDGTIALYIGPGVSVEGAQRLLGVRVALHGCVEVLLTTSTETLILQVPGDVRRRWPFVATAGAALDRGFVVWDGQRRVLDGDGDGGLPEGSLAADSASFDGWVCTAAVTSVGAECTWSTPQGCSTRTLSGDVVRALAVRGPSPQGSPQYVIETANGALRLVMWDELDPEHTLERQAREEVGHQRLSARASETYDVFVSYAHDGVKHEWTSDCCHPRIIARQVEEIGRHRQLKVFWDDQIGGGDRFHEVLQATLEAARIVVVLWGRGSVERWDQYEKWKREEEEKESWKFKLPGQVVELIQLQELKDGQAGKKIIPVVLEGVEREKLPDVLRSQHPLRWGTDDFPTRLENALGGATGAVRG